MMTILWWFSLIFTLYFGSRLVVGTIKKNLKFAKWTFIVFLVSMAFCLAMF